MEMFNNLFRLRRPEYLSSQESKNQLGRFIATCTPDERRALSKLISCLDLKTIGSHVGVFLIAGCADPRKGERRKDIDLRVVTETKAGTQKRIYAVGKLRENIPKLLNELGLNVEFSGESFGIPRFVDARVGGKPERLLMGPSRSDISTSLKGDIRTLDIFVQSAIDPPLSIHHLVEKELNCPYVCLSDTRYGFNNLSSVV